MAYRLTERRLDAARDILDKYAEQLRRSKRIDSMGLEHELRETWDLGYRELKDIMSDLLKTDEYKYIAAYYMQHQNPMGPVSEFKADLAALYGLNWYDSPERQKKQAAFWKRYFEQGVA